MSFSFPLMNSEVPFATPAIILTKLTRSVVSVTFGVIGVALARLGPAFVNRRDPAMCGPVVGDHPLDVGVVVAALVALHHADEDLLETAFGPGRVDGLDDLRVVGRLDELDELFGAQVLRIELSLGHAVNLLGSAPLLEFFPRRLDPLLVELDP